jgi:hypothetical protein
LVTFNIALTKLLHGDNDGDGDDGDSDGGAGDNGGADDNGGNDNGDEDDNDGDAPDTGRGNGKYYLALLASHIVPIEGGAPDAVRRLYIAYTALGLHYPPGFQIRCVLYIVPFSYRV